PSRGMNAQTLPRLPIRHAMSSGQRLGVPVEQGLRVYGEGVAEPLPEAAGPGVLAVDARQQPPRPPPQPRLEVGGAGATYAPALQAGVDAQQVLRRVSRVRVVELVVEVAGHHAAANGVPDQRLYTVRGLGIHQHQLDVPAGVRACCSEVGADLL